jgi:hypothetical protein
MGQSDRSKQAKLGTDYRKPELLGDLDNPRGASPFRSAVALYQRALAILKKAPGREHLDIATILENWALLLATWADRRKPLTWKLVATAILA